MPLSPVGESARAKAGRQGNLPVCVLQERACIAGGEVRLASAAPLMVSSIGAALDVAGVAVPWNMTHTSFGMPRGLRYLPPRTKALNQELGRDHAWLPVTHTHTLQGAWQVGLWFHYARE